MIFEVRSQTGRLIRLTETSWQKIARDHPELRGNSNFVDEIAQTVRDPDFVVQGWTTKVLALRWCEAAPKAPKHICVVYRELNGDGFVITAFFISRYERVLRRPILWQREP